MRYLVMGIALNDSLEGGRGRRALQAQALVDASFVVAHRGGGRFDFARLVGATVPQWSCWLLGTLIGLLLRPDPELVHRLGGAGADAGRRTDRGGGDGRGPPAVSFSEDAVRN